MRERKVLNSAKDNLSNTTRYVGCIHDNRERRTHSSYSETRIETLLSALLVYVAREKVCTKAKVDLKDEMGVKC